eukprot:403360868
MKTLERHKKSLQKEFFSIPTSQEDFSSTQKNVFPPSSKKHDLLLESPGTNASNNVGQQKQTILPEINQQQLKHLQQPRNKIKGDNSGIVLQQDSEQITGNVFISNANSVVDEEQRNTQKDQPQKVNKILKQSQPQLSKQQTNRFNAAAQNINEMIQIQAQKKQRPLKLPPLISDQNTLNQVQNQDSAPKTFVSNPLPQKMSQPTQLVIQSNIQLNDQDQSKQVIQSNNEQNPLDSTYHRLKYC